MGICKLTPTRLLFECETESSGPSSTCSQSNDSGTTASSRRSMSVRTVGSQFSLSVSAADVCCRKRKRMPIWVRTVVAS